MAVICIQFKKLVKAKILALIIRWFGWGWLPNALLQYRRRIRNTLWSFDPGPLCFDICCGTGLTSIEKATQWPHTFFYCIDINKTELAKGQALANALGVKNINFILGDAHHLPFKDKTVNTAIVANILRDLPDIPTILAEWSKLLNKQSNMIIETPMAPQKHILFKIKSIKNFVKHYVNPDHGFVDGELENLLRSIDFIPVKQLRVFNSLGVLARECHYILTAIYPALSAIFWWPLYIMMIIGNGSANRGNAVTLIAERK
jgi:ubiquinone/menaquinone biosynthesis C-methylase UbiE